MLFGWFKLEAFYGGGSMTKVLSASIVCFWGSCLLGCSTIRMGHKWDTEAVKTFKEGETTKADVIKKLGEPMNRQMNSDGSEIWLYWYQEAHGRMNPASLFVPFYPMEVETHSTGQSLWLTFVGDKIGKLQLGPGQIIPSVGSAPMAPAGAIQGIPVGAAQATSSTVTLQPGIEPAAEASTPPTPKS